MINGLVLDDPSREAWIYKTSSCRNTLTLNKSPKLLDYHINIQVDKDTIEPMHIVLLACLIVFIERNKYEVCLSGKDDIISFLMEDVNLDKYINCGANYIEANSKSVLNLWKIIDGRTEERSFVVQRYLSSVYFKGYDLSGLTTAINEVHGNIIDHSESKDNAFSYIEYDYIKGVIHVAACDFGLGICRTLRRNNVFESDQVALKQSVEVGVSARTNPHNKGFGLDNIISNLKNGGNIRIVSNTALLYCIENKQNIELHDMKFNFQGTLIYFTIPISNFEKAEMLDDCDI